MFISNLYEGRGFVLYTKSFLNAEQVEFDKSSMILCGVTLNYKTESHYLLVVYIEVRLHQ